MIFVVFAQTKFKKRNSLDFEPLLQSGSYGLFSSHTAYRRSHGDINVVMALLEFIGNDNNSDIISKIAYGPGTSDGISLGLIGNFLDLGISRQAFELYTIGFFDRIPYKNYSRTK